MYYVPGLILELVRTRELPDHCQISVRRTEHPTRQEQESRTLSQVDQRAGGCLSDLSRSAHMEQDVKWEFSCCIIGGLKTPRTSHSAFRPTAAGRPATTPRVQWEVPVPRTGPVTNHLPCFPSQLKPPS